MDSSGIFITGGDGQLGKALRIKYPYAKFANKDTLDITNRSSVEKFDWAGIHTIINAAAYTKVDTAETIEGRPMAWAVNADAVGNLVAIAAHYDITLVHISTDYVFDGTVAPHSEDEAFSPLSVYGSSKAAGDLAVSLAPKFYIIRTSWVIGDGNNFVKTMINLAEKGINPTVVSDQIGRLTFTSVLVSAIDHLLTTKSSYGTYNVSNDGDEVSWATIARKIFELCEFSNTVTDITTTNYYATKENIAPRPLLSTLDLTKIKSTGLALNDWCLDLENYISTIH